MSKFSIKTARGVASFRRAGLEFGREPIEIDSGKISKKRFEAILAEPRLDVTEIEPESGNESGDPMQKLAKGAVAVIAESIPGLSDDELRDLAEHEQHGKNRQSVLNAIGAEQLKRDESEGDAKSEGDAGSEGDVKHEGDAE